VLDLCCGPARHAAALTRSGYAVIGLDIDARALRDASARAPDARLLRGDMRQIPLRDASVDAVICMWQSFGHFDAATNRAVLGEMARVLGPAGVLVLDLYHRGFHAAHAGERVIERDGHRIHERRTMCGNRLRVRLRYEASMGDEVFEWQLYTPAEMTEMARSLGMSARVVCAEFDERIPASEERARAQLVFVADRPSLA
jgi:SAM-dependent methyltransferase